MRSLWIVLLVLCAATSRAAEIASVTFGRIEPILKELVLANPQYADLKKSSEEAGTFDPTSFMKTDDKGNIVFGKEQLQQTSKMTSRFKVDKLIKEAMLRELVLLIEGMDLKHDIVVNRDESDALLYSNVEIEDITQKIYQELVKRLRDREPIQSIDGDKE